MGLFSKSDKNKQESTEDSGYYRAADDRNLAERARAKRAAHAGAEAAAARGRGRTGRETPDPVLPEKKRARRRLVGAIALALAVAIGLPMVLDSEPKPLVNDIAIQIPAKDKPAEAAPVAEPAEAPQAEPESRRHVAQADALDGSEEIVEPAEPAPKNSAAAAAPIVTPKPAPKDTIAWTEPKALTPEPKKEGKPEHKETKAEKAAEKAAEHKAKAEAEAKADVRRAKAEAEAKTKADAEAKAKLEAQHKAEPKGDDASRALAILEGKAAAKPAAAESGRFVVQVAALAAKDKVDELQEKLQAAGIKSFTQKSPSGELTRVKVGPFGSREEAEKAKARLQKIGLSGSLVPV